MGSAFANLDEGTFIFSDCQFGEVRHADLAFPAPPAVEVATTLRNMLKKVRSKLRVAIADLLKNAEAPKGGSRNLRNASIGVADPHEGMSHTLLRLHAELDPLLECPF